MMRFGQVTIVGSGIAGLCAAAAIAPSAEDVRVLCKDGRPVTPKTRKSVPQGDHISILLQAGLLNLERLLPGIHEELIQAGAACIRAGTGQQVYINGCWTHERPLDLVFLGQSRPFLEYHIHRRVACLENVTLMPEVRVHELMFGDDNRVSGVLGTTVNGENFNQSADLVIDATGNGGHLFRQVESFLGSEVPVDTMDIGIFYATAFFTKPPEYRDRAENILILPEAGKSHIGGSLIDIEQDAWCVSLHGRQGASPPRDMEEWMAMARALPDPRIWKRVRNGTLIRPMKIFRKPRAHWRHFENVESGLPAGYLPIGDVISSLNPIFGQGMTVSIGHAGSLSAACNIADTERGEGGESSESAFQRSYLAGAANWSRQAWMMTRQYEQRLAKTGSLTEREQQVLAQLSERYHESIRSSEEAHLQVVRQSQMLGL